MSRETKWTPGPWHSRGYPTISAGKGKGMVAKVLERYMDRAEREANAHLIAAAPEVYEKLEKLVERVEQMQYDHNTSDGDLSLDESRAALAKARGEKP